MRYYMLLAPLVDFAAVVDVAAAALHIAAVEEHCWHRVATAAPAEAVVPQTEQFLDHLGSESVGTD